MPPVRAPMADPFRILSRSIIVKHGYEYKSTGFVASRRARQTRHERLV